MTRHWLLIGVVVLMAVVFGMPQSVQQVHATGSGDMVYSAALPGLCLTGSSVGGTITLETCRGLDTQYWSVGTSGTWSHRADATLCIAQTSAGSWDLHMADCSDELVVATEPNPDFVHGYRLKTTNLALDVYVDVKRLVLYPNHSGYNQQFHWYADDLATLTSNASTIITYPIARTDTAAYTLDVVRDRVARIQPPFEIPASAVRNPDVFPGLVTASARVSQTFSFPLSFRNHAYLRMSTPPQNWMSTGLYAAPGEIVTITVSGATSADMANVYVQLGVHTDELYLDSYNVVGDGHIKRNPRVTLAVKLEPGVNQVRTPYGGPIILRSDQSRNATITVTIANAVQAPYFKRGVTTEAEWLARRSVDVPLAEIESNLLVIHAPSSEIRTRTYAEMVELTTHYDTVVTKINELAGLSPTAALPHTTPQGKQRIAEDIQISAGWGHSGFPVMVYTAWSLLDPADVSRRAEGWGVWHEIGHNYQMGAWADVMGGEVSVNWWSLFVEESVHGTSRLMLDDVYKRAQTRLNNASITNKWQDADPFDQLTLFEQLRIAHPTLNWGMYTQMMRHYREMSQSAYDALDTDAKKINYFVRTLCGVTKTNVAPHFQRWSFSLTSATTTACAFQRAIAGPWLIDGIQSRHAQQGSGKLLYERWNSVSGSTVDSLTGHANYPRYPSIQAVQASALELTSTSLTNVGQRMRAYLHPPVTGYYRFWLAGDDSARLRLSTSVRVTDAVTIIDLTSATSFRGFTNMVQSSQRSARVYLQAGQRYYIELLHKNASSSAHASVAWEIPAGNGRVYESARPLEAKFLSPYVADVALSASTKVTTTPNARVDVPLTVRNVSADTASQMILEATLPNGMRLAANSQGWRSGYRYVRFIADGEAGNSGPWAAVAELSLRTPQGTAVPKSAWRIAQLSSQEIRCESGAATNAIDGNTSTYWHTDYCTSVPAHPHSLTIDMGSWYPLRDLIYTPRPAGHNGNVSAYRVQVSIDGYRWVAAASGTFVDDGSTQTALLTVPTPLVRIVAGPIAVNAAQLVNLPLISSTTRGTTSVNVVVQRVHDRTNQPWLDSNAANNRRVIAVTVQR